MLYQTPPKSATLLYLFQQLPFKFQPSEHKCTLESNHPQCNLKHNLCEAKTLSPAYFGYRKRNHKFILFTTLSKTKFLFTFFEYWFLNSTRISILNSEWILLKQHVFYPSYIDWGLKYCREILSKVILLKGRILSIGYICHCSCERSSSSHYYSTCYDFVVNIKIYLILCLHV